jgi:hypothetical protein
LITFRKEYVCHNCTVRWNYDNVPLDFMKKFCLCGGVLRLSLIIPMKNCGESIAVYDWSDKNISSTELRSRLQTQNCTQCGIRTKNGRLCDVCDSMYNAVSSPWFIAAQQEWEEENTRRIGIKRNLMGG